MQGLGVEELQNSFYPLCNGSGPEQEQEAGPPKQGREAEALIMDATVQGCGRSRMCLFIEASHWRVDRYEPSI